MFKHHFDIITVISHFFNRARFCTLKCALKSVKTVQKLEAENLETL
jgi:hypothetical protein